MCRYMPFMIFLPIDAQRGHERKPLISLYSFFQERGMIDAIDNLPARSPTEADLEGKSGYRVITICCLCHFPNHFPPSLFPLIVTSSSLQTPFTIISFLTLVQGVKVEALFFLSFFFFFSSFCKFSSMLDVRSLSCEDLPPSSGISEGFL